MMNGVNRTLKCKKIPYDAANSYVILLYFR